LRFATTHGEGKQDQSLDDYMGRAGKEQDKIYYLLAENHLMAAASPHLEGLKKNGIEVLLLTDRIDPWVVESLGEYDGKPFEDVARGDLELPEGEGKLTQDANDQANKPFLKKLRRVLKDRVATVTVSRRLVESPACVVAAADELNPQLRRILEASGQELPESKPTLEINTGHPLLTKLSAEPDDKRFEMLSNIVLDHALLAEGSQLENPAEYVRRMNDLLLELDSAPGSG
jgi:molecular chaperone HtpG